MLKVLIHLEVSMENVIFDVGITGHHSHGHPPQQESIKC